MDKATKDKILLEIAHYLILNGSFATNTGLMNGKTGITVFFFHYFRYTEKKLYDKFAGELLNEISLEIHKNTPKSFKDGLTGIAWGIEYLIRNNFILANPDEALEELDMSIIEQDVRRINDYSLETGLKGIAYYVINRCGNRKLNRYITTDYIQELIHSIEMNPQIDSESVLLNKKLTDILNKKDIIISNEWLLNLLKTSKYNTKNIFKPGKALGIMNGYAGIGLKLLWEDLL